MPHATRAGDVLAARYRLVDLLSESAHGRFWRAHDRVLERHVALHVMDSEDPRAALMLDAAKRAATVVDARFLRVLDAERTEKCSFVVNEWGSGTSLDIMLANNGPLSPREAAWIVSEVSDSVATAHAHAIAHGRLVPENILVDNAGDIRIIGFCVDAALHGLPPGELRTDVRDLAGLLHAGLTGKWAGDSASAVPRVPRDHGRVLRPRQVRAGVPRPLDDLCDELLNPKGSRVRDVRDIASARGIHAFLSDFVGDDAGLARRIADRNPDKHEMVCLPFVPDILARPDDVQGPDDPDIDGQRIDSPPLATGADDGAPGTDPGPPAEDEGALDAEPDAAPTDAAGVSADESADESAAESAAEPPTEAGLPIFDDETGDVSWLEKRRDPPPPPPPFEEPPARPLFADDAPRRTASPGAGDSTDRGRPGGPHRGPKGDAFWPSPTDSGDGSHSASVGTLGAAHTSGSGIIPAYVDPEGATVPGRGWLRLALVPALVLLSVIALAIAFNLSRGRTPLGGVTSPSTSQTSDPSTSVAPATLTTLSGVTATDFDPQGDPPRENPDAAVNAVDGDLTTSWKTSTYKQQLGPGGLKSGVGLLLDLGETHLVGQVRISIAGEGAGFELYLSEVAPTEIGEMQPAETETLPSGAVELSGAATGRYLVVWLTALPKTDDGQFRGEILEVVVDVEEVA